jgi:hypothetical protein
MTESTTKTNEKTNNIPVVGIVPWGSGKTKSSKFNNDVPRIPYMRLKPGINNVRVVTELGVYCCVRWKGPKTKGRYGDRIRTSYPAYGDDCPVKKFLGMEGKERYMAIVIDRRAQKLRENEKAQGLESDEAEFPLKLLDIGELTKEQIETNLEVKNSIRTDGTQVSPRDFDMSIKFDPNAKSAIGFYSVVAHDADPMSEADLALIEGIGGQEMLDKILAKQLVCPKPETVIKNLKKLGWDGSTVIKAEKGNHNTPLEEPVADDYSFTRPEDTDQATDERADQATD